MGKAPVTSLCGFLGSGQAALLAHVLDQDPSSTAVVINEFGEVSIDYLIVAELAEKIPELRNACLCCTIRGDLAMTLRDPYHKRQLGEIKAFDHCPRDDHTSPIMFSGRNFEADALDEKFSARCV
jgi:G3E family GTPase